MQSVTRGGSSIIGGPPNLLIVRLLKSYIPLAAICVAITVGVAVLVTVLSPTVYGGQMTLAVGTDDAVVSADLGSEAQPITNTVSQLLRTYGVARAVIDEQNLDMTPTEFLKKLEVEQKPDAAALDITYKAPSKEEAVDVLKSLTAVYEKQLREVSDETLGGTISAGGATGGGARGEESQPNIQIAVRVFDPPHALDEQISPRPVRNIGVAFILGLLFAAFWLALREALGGRLGGGESAAPEGTASDDQGQGPSRTVVGAVDDERQRGRAAG